VAAQTDFAEALATARSEALHAFGSAEVILEKAVIAPRHVEVQVFADTHGNVVHMGERDCSVQRRHQKMIEEAPSPAVGAELRRRMGMMAVNAAKAIGYVGAGTIECLLDAGGDFYFMEMNTRLQVEHPVTEALTGFDLVEWQLRVARGEVLPVNDQSEIMRRFEFGGHAIEVRLCAEDPSQEFLPQSGRVLDWQPADTDAGLRIDAALETGMEVAPYYDSMLAKLIGHGASRDEARTRLAQALDDTVLLGFASNRSYLAACLRNPRFANGQATTAFIDQEGTALLATADDAAPALLSAALYAWRSTSRSPLAARYEVPMRLELDGIVHAIAMKPLADKGFMAVHAGKAHEYSFSGKSANTIFVKSGAGLDAVSFAFTESRDPIEGEAQWRGRRYVLRDLTLAPTRSEFEAGGATVVKAPMAGRVVAVRAKAGDAVVKGTPLLVLEAMKMEHVVVARGPGKIAALLVEAGTQVALGQLLVRIDA
jgi:geranyl-CoA carboxylase alpha subunit